MAFLKRCEVSLKAYNKSQFSNADVAAGKRKGLDILYEYGVEDEPGRYSLRMSDNAGLPTLSPGNQGFTEDFGPAGCCSVFSFEESQDFGGAGGALMPLIFGVQRFSLSSGLAIEGCFFVGVASGVERLLAKTLASSPNALTTATCAGLRLSTSLGG